MNSEYQSIAVKAEKLYDMNIEKIYSEYSYLEKHKIVEFDKCISVFDNNLKTEFFYDIETKIINNIKIADKDLKTVFL